MSEQEIADKILQDILSLPGARSLGILARSIPSDNENYPLAQWILTGENPPNLNELFKSPFGALPTKEKAIESTISILTFKLSPDELKQVTSQATGSFAKNPNIQQLIKQLKMSRAFWNTFMGRSVYIDSFPGALADWLLTGKSNPSMDEKELDRMFLVNPEKFQTYAIKRIQEYNPHAIESIGKLLTAEGHGDEIALLNKLPEDEKIKHLLEILLKYQVEEDVQDIFDYFYSAPVAPEAPYVPADKSLTTGLNGGGPVYESCVQDVKAKQTSGCADMGYPAYGEDVEGHKCYNPWAVCTKTVGRNR